MNELGNILITSAGQRVSLVRLFQKELKKLNQNNKVYTVDLNPKLAPACHISDGYRQIIRVTDNTYIEELIDICIKWNVKIVIPTIDTELKILSLNTEILLSKGIVPNVSSYDFITKCREKSLTNDFFVENNIEIPRPVTKGNPTFPMFIKPFDGSLSKDTFLIKEIADLKDHFLTNSRMMFMEYIDHDTHDEYTVDTYYDKNNELKCVIPRKRIVVRAGEINKGVTKNNELVECVKNNLSYIPGAIGCITMQFFFNRITKRIIGIEINPRFGGGYPLSYLAGANFPNWLIREYMLNDKIVFFDSWESDLLMLRYDDEILVHNYEE
jgi:carbamoyl-phosphate synthase large subunit